MTKPTRGRLRDLIEVSGLLAVILSLVFVGLELRQTASAVRAAAFQSMTSDAHDVNLARAANPDLSLALRLWLEDAEALTQDQADLAWAWEFSVLRHFENIHRQAELGVLPLEDVERRLALHANFDSPRFSVRWARAKIGFSPSFVAYVDDYLIRER